MKNTELYNNRMCLGKYDNENFTLVNVLEAKGEVLNLVQVHEVIHMLLALQTKWGCTEYYFDHIGRMIDSKYLYISQSIHKACEYVQESLAEFWEKLFIYKKYGEERFINALNEEKWKSPQTFEYLKGTIEIVKRRKDLSIDNIAFCLYRIAVSSMNIEIVDIPIDKWEYLNDNEEYLSCTVHDTPNEVFQNLLKTFLENLNDGNNISVFLESLENDWSCATLENRQLQVNTILEYIKSICKKSECYNEICNYLSTVKCKEVNIDNIEEYVIPVAFSGYEIKYDFNIQDATSTVVFIYGNGKDIYHTVENKAYRDKFRSFLDISQTYLAVEFSCYSEKTKTIDMLSLSRLRKIINTYRLSTIVSYKAFETNESLVKQLEYGKSRYYIYCDRPYWSAKQTIESICKNKYWKVIQFETFDVICLRVGKCGIFFLPVINANAFYLDLNIFYSGDIVEAKDMFEEEDYNKFLLIINCLFGT